MTAQAFMKGIVFDPVKEYPWSLGMGNVKANLLRLKEADTAIDPAAWKIQKLLQKTSDTTDIEAGIRLLMQVTWTTNTTEQQR
eukprot:381172-Lingulodinium_polyedra.AAC.1